MHRFPVSLPLLLAALFVHAEHPLIYTSPARFADEVADVCSARGGESGSPEPEVRSRPLVVDRSTLIRTLAGFPQDFLDGLVAEERYGYISFPISVRIDPASGCALFENAAGRVFYAIAPVAGNPAAPIIPAGNVLVKWRVLPEDFNTGTPRLRTSDSGLRTLAPDTLRLSSIACSTNGVAIGAAWPASDAPTNGVLDLYFSTHLDRDWRVLKTMTIPAGATNLATFLAIDDIPSYTNRPPAHVHDADCHIVTNISPNIFSGGVVVTNIHWSCAGQRTPPYEGDSGFFRLGTRDDTDGDGLPDAYETIILGTNPLLADSDEDGLWDDGELDAGTDPLNPDTDGDGLDDGDERLDVRVLEDGTDFWIDVSALTNAAVLFATMDDHALSMPCPVPFHAFGAPVQTLSVNANGLVGLAAGAHGLDSGHAVNAAIGQVPLPGGLSATVAAFWDDLRIRAGSPGSVRFAVAGESPNRMVVLDFDRTGFYGGTTNDVVSFQVHLRESETNVVHVLYGATNGLGNAASATLGVRRGPSSVEFSRDTPGAVFPGLHLAYRIGTGTDPLVADTDGDGLDDGDELGVHHTDPFLADTDGDGLSDGWEVAASLNPLAPDSDNDGMPDGWEVAHALAPLDAADAATDADSDGLPNLREYGEGTDPGLPDTDHDGLSDFDETSHARQRALWTVPWFDLPDEAVLTPTNEVDDAVYSFPLAGPTSFCGILCTNVLADVNGLVTLPAAARNVSRSSKHSNHDLLETTVWQHDCAVAAYWDDLRLRPSLGSAILAANVETNGGTYCVVEYRNVGFQASGGGSVSFQVSFAYGSPTNAVNVRYGDITDPRQGASATFGIQGPNRFTARQLSHNATNAVAQSVAHYLFGTGSRPTMLDTDSDGLEDAEEVALGTNPHLADTDGDGLPDAWEVANGLNPVSAAGDDGWSGDPDGDGRSNGNERSYGTSPVLCDTNGDGIPDGYSGSVWSNHVLRASVAGATNVLVSYSATVPEGASCALRIGTLTIPLSGSGTLALFLDPGTAYTFRLASTGGASASLSLQPPDAPPMREILANSNPLLWLDDPSGVFGGNVIANGMGTISFLTLSLRTVPEGQSECVHETPGIRTYEVVSTPVPWSAIQDSAAIEGFTANADGTLSLAVADTPRSVVTGMVTVVSSLAFFGSASVSATIHRCEATAAGPCPSCYSNWLTPPSSMTTISPNPAFCLAGSTNRVHFTLSETSPPLANWTLMAIDNGGAQLFEEEFGGTPKTEIVDASEVWVDVGSDVGAYVVHAISTECSATHGDAMLYVGEVELDNLRYVDAGPTGTFNPCGIPLSAYSLFRVAVTPASIPDSAIVWKAEPTNSVHFALGNTGRTVTVEGLVAGDVTLSVRVDSGPRHPQVRAKVVDWSDVPVRAWIVGDGQYWAASPATVTNYIREANQVFRQVGMRFSLEYVNTTNCNEWLDIAAPTSTNSPLFQLTSLGNGEEGVELYFVNDTWLKDLAAFNFPRGIVLTTNANARACAHEIGHACGLADIFDVYGDQPYMIVNGDVTPASAPLDWNSTGSEGFYPEEVSRGNAITENLMYGANWSDGRKLCLGRLFGIQIHSQYDYATQQFVDTPSTNLVPISVFHDGTTHPTHQ